MRTRSKIALAVSVGGILAGTSGAALAAVGTPRVASMPRVASQPAKKVTGEIMSPIYAAQARNSVVREPGSLTVTVQASGCITDVRAWAYSGGSVASPVTNGVDTRKGTAFTLRVPFPKGTATGTWYLTSVDATVCGTKTSSWNTEWDGYDTFTVQR